MHFKHAMLVLLLYVFSSVHAFIERDLIVSFFRKKNLSHNVVITCLNNKAQLELSKALMEEASFLLQLTRIKFSKIMTMISNNYKRMGIVLDGDCKEAKTFVLKAGNHKVFDSKHFWLVLHNSTDPQQLFKYVNLNIESEIKVAHPIPRESKNFSIYDVYNPAYGRGGELRASKVGFFDYVERYVEYDMGNKYEKRRDLSGVQFRTGVVLPEPFACSVEEYLKNDRDIQINTFNRYHSRLMSYCEQYYNFSMRIALNRSWGYLRSDGTIDGLVGDLAREKIDFGLSPLFVKPERINLISYGRKTWNLRAAFILRNPKSRKSYQIFVKPLSLEVWLCIVGCSVLAVYSQRLGYSFDKKVRDGDVDISWGFSVICTFGAFCQQGIIGFPNCLSGRTAAYVTLLLGLLIYQFYSASLVSFLLNVPTTVISTVQEILDNGYRIGCEDVLYDKDFLKHSTDTVVNEVFRKLTILSHSNETGFLKPEVGLELVKQGRYAFHVELATGYPIIVKDFAEATVCELKEVPMFPVQRMYANYQKWSPFKNAMDICLHRLAENGVMVRETLFWHPKKPECVRFADTINISTGLEDFYPALCVLLIGIVCALEILGMEIVWSRRDFIKKFFQTRAATFSFEN
ncbi:ionotropic receptor 75a-like [Euwallacea fornicatus]|uniref:ionotropic receptor 75a-like n=1 Tax=Euwallacea fornicatus TaxID=995702 RepID=UPI00338EF0FD